jgi:hypothetical protein
VYRNTLLTGLAAVVLASAAFAAAPPPRPLDQAAIARLIEQLGDRDYRTREMAERRLHSAGLPALPLLRKAMGHRDLEVRRRALRLVPGMENAIMFAPRRVTLLVRDQPIAKVLEHLSKASGYQVVNQSGPIFIAAPVPVAAAAAPAPAAAKAPREKTFTYNFVNTPFWDVVDRICRDAGLMVQQSWGDEAIRLYQTSGPAPHVGRSGPFRYVAQNFQLYRNVDLSTSPGGGRSESLTFSFNLFAEPRLPFMGMGEVRLESAYDNLRNSMLIKTNTEVMDPWGGRFWGRRYYGGYYKQLTMQVSVNLERRSEKANLMKYLKGVVPMTVLTAQKPMVIADKILTAKKGVTKTIGDLEFKVEEVKKVNNNQVSVKFTVNNKKNNDYTWQNSIYNRVELHDDKGNKFQIWGTSWHSSTGNNVTMTLTYGQPGVAKPGSASKFVFVHWETKQFDVEFEFRDVPLP